MTTQQFFISGLTCGHCAASVAEEVSALHGVSTASVDLVPHGISTIVIDSVEPVEHGRLADALEEAGDYRLVTP